MDQVSPGLTDLEVPYWTARGIQPEAYALPVPNASPDTALMTANGDWAQELAKFDPSLSQGPSDGVARGAAIAPSSVLVGLGMSGRDPTDITIPVLAGSDASSGGDGGDAIIAGGSGAAASAGDGSGAALSSGSSASSSGSSTSGGSGGASSASGAAADGSGSASTGGGGEGGGAEPLDDESANGSHESAGFGGWLLGRIGAGAGAVFGFLNVWGDDVQAKIMADGSIAVYYIDKGYTGSSEPVFVGTLDPATEQVSRNGSRVTLGAVLHEANGPWGATTGDWDAWFAANAVTEDPSSSWNMREDPSLNNGQALDPKYRQKVNTAQGAMTWLAEQGIMFYAGLPFYIGASRAAIAAPGGAEFVFRGDTNPSSAVNSKGVPKSFLNGVGDLVPANPSGVYQGRSVSVGEHILSGFRRGAKSNSPFTSFTPSGEVASGYGAQRITVDIAALKAAIQSGEVEGVQVLEQGEIQALIRNDALLSDYWKNLASKWSARDQEVLIRGIIPNKFIKVG